MAMMKGGNEGRRMQTTQRCAALPLLLLIIIFFSYLSTILCTLPTGPNPFSPSSGCPFPLPPFYPSTSFIIHSFLTGGRWNKLCNFWASFTPLPSTPHPVALFQLPSTSFPKVPLPAFLLYQPSFIYYQSLLCCVNSHPSIPYLPPKFLPPLDFVFEDS